MNKYFQHYFSSFREKEIIVLFGIDILFWGLMFLIVSGLGIFLAKEIQPLKLQSPEQIQQLLLTSPEQAQVLASSLRNTIFLLLAISIILIAASFLAYTLSRAIMCHRLLRQKLRHKHYWKWNLLALVLIFPLLLFLIPAIILGFVLNGMIALIPSTNLVAVLSNIILFILVLFFLFFIFLAHYCFARKYKVWESIGEAFHYLARKYLWKSFLGIVVTFLILNMVLLVIQQLFFSANYQNAFIVVTLAFFLLFLAWMRVFMVRTITTEQTTTSASEPST